MTAFDKAESRGLARMLGKAALFAVLNFIIGTLVNSRNSEVASDIGSVQLFVTFVLLVWGLFTASFYSRTDEEWKNVSEAVRKTDFEAFKIEVSKRIGPTFRALYLIMSFLAILSFYFFHNQSVLVTFGEHFFIAFLVTITILVIWDMDDPLTGVINVSGIPEDWAKK